MLSLVKLSIMVRLFAHNSAINIYDDLSFWHYFVALRPGSFQMQQFHLLSLCGCDFFKLLFEVTPHGVPLSL